jgi:tetratricopeptide (TPR) repeat protein
VLELMQQAVQLDPKAEYYALLGQVQRRNPQWKAGAVSSYRDAVRCKPDDPELRLGFAQILEEMGDRKQAGVQYRAALEMRPNDERLQQALDHFENPPKAVKSKSSGSSRSLMDSLRALLRRDKVVDADGGKGPKGAGSPKGDWSGQSTTFEIDVDKKT